jgi:hypothetical protein
MYGQRRMIEGNRGYGGNWILWHRRKPARLYLHDFRALNLTRHLSIPGTSASTKVMKIIYGVCVSIIIMVIGFLIIRKRKVFIKRFRRRDSKFIVFYCLTLLNTPFRKELSCGRSTSFSEWRSQTMSTR